MLIKLLTRWFVREAENVTAPSVRAAYGKMAGLVGILANVLLFGGKVLAGVLSGSVAIIADAFNNLSDAGSSIVTLIGFRLSSAPPDKEHPFGHGRMEYLSALTVAALIMVAGVELATSAVDKILHPEPAEFSLISAAILVASIGVKAWMAYFNTKIGKRIDSDALTATATDCRNDVLCTAVVLASSLFTYFTHINIDGWVGAAVALFVIWSGFSILRETVSPLLGQAPDPALVDEIRRIVLEQDGIVGIHDLIVHNYGPGRCIVSLHAEVPCDADILYSHEIIDLTERQLSEELNLIACIHMDPIDTKDERVNELRATVAEIIGQIDAGLSMHDFRVVFGEHRSNVIFDVVVPFDYTGADTLQHEIEQRLQAVAPQFFVVITVDRDYSGGC